MFLTSAECRTLAEQKLAEADRDDRHRRRLIVAAEGWFFLASQLRHFEKRFKARGTKRRSHNSTPKRRRRVS